MTKHQRVINFLGSLFKLFVSSTFASLILMCSCKYENAKPPNIPTSAEWRGGSDGGYWFEVLSYNQENIRVRIYNEFTGKIEIDADFKPEIGCKKPNFQNFIQTINFFNGLNIVTFDCVFYPITKYSK